MSITVFADVIVPNAIIAAGIKGKQMRKNTRTTAANGDMQINIDWAKTVRTYEIGFCPMPVASWRLIEGLHEVTEGGAYGMLLQDPKDFTVAATAGRLQPTTGALGFGYGEPLFTSWTRQTSVGTTRYKDRKITRPMAGAVLKRGGVTLTAGAGAGQYALDATTGVVTMVADNSQAHSSITIGATTVLNYATGAFVATLAPGDRVYITGVTGTAATTLNGKSHAITAEGATSFTIATSTTGLTASGGTSFKYPQASETMTWGGSFYVPVHFMSDEIDWELVAAGQNPDARFLAGPSLTLVEVLE